jgi:hypothetical protein
MANTDDEFEKEFHIAQSSLLEENVLCIAFIRCSDVYVLQDINCPLWIACVQNKVSLSTAYADWAGGDWKTLISIGFNRNFLTRKRWLCIDTLVDEMGIDYQKLKSDLKVDKKQIDSWRLTKREISKLKIPENSSSNRMACALPSVLNTIYDSDNYDDEEWQ